MPSQSSDGRKPRRGEVALPDWQIALLAGIAGALATGVFKLAEQGLEHSRGRRERRRISLAERYEDYLRLVQTVSDDMADEWVRTGDLEQWSEQYRRSLAEVRLRAHLYGSSDVIAEADVLQGALSEWIGTLAEAAEHESREGHQIQARRAFVHIVMPRIDSLARAMRRDLDAA